MPFAVREEWSQQAWVELLDLWIMFGKNGGRPADFPGYAEAHLPRRMRAWWNRERRWGQLTLVADYDPNKYVVEETVRIEVEELTPGESRVWYLLDRGYRPREIAQLLGKSYPAVRKTISRILRKQHDIAEEARVRGH